MEQGRFLPAENREGAIPIGGGWMICKSRFVCQGKLYYYNVFTGHSLWSLPPAVFAARPPFPPRPPVAFPTPQGHPVPSNETHPKRANPQQEPYGPLPKKQKSSTGVTTGAPPEAIQSSFPDEERPLVIDEDKKSPEPDNDGKTQDTGKEDGVSAEQQGQTSSNEKRVGTMQLFRNLRMEMNKDESMLRPDSVSFMDIVKPDSQESLVGERRRWLFFVLDTGVLLHRPDIIYDLQVFNRWARTTKIDRRVKCVIPWATLQELEMASRLDGAPGALQRLAQTTMDFISSSRDSDLKELLWIQPLRDEFAFVGLRVSVFEDRIIRCILLIREKASLRQNVVVACTDQESLAKKARSFNVKVMAPEEVKGILKK